MTQISTLRELRRIFWSENPTLDKRRRVKMGDEMTYVTDTRVAWCDFVESTRRNGDITESLAGRATL